MVAGCRLPVVGTVRWQPATGNRQLDKESLHMKLTPLAKLFITVVILGVVGYTAWHYKGGTLRKWATGSDKGSSQKSGSDNVSSNDFDALKNAPADPSRDAGSNGVQPAALSGSGKLSRPLVVAINT